MNTAQRVVITGATGMLGRALMREFAEWKPLGLGYSRTGPGIERLDLLDFAATRDLLERERPRVIIHAAAERRPDVSEQNPEAALALNVASTRHLAQLARELGAWLLYISTDYVFDGTQPPYKPEDQPNPLNFYGKTKWEGEQAVLEEAPDGGILRVGVLFGQVEYPAESAVFAVIKDLENGAAKKVDHWAQRYPTYVDDVAYVCRKMAERAMEGQAPQGRWHFCGTEKVTKYEQALVIAEVLGLDSSHLVADPNEPAGAARPRDCQLDCSALEAAGFARWTGFRDAVRESLQR